MRRRSAFGVYSHPGPSHWNDTWLTMPDEEAWHPGAGDWIEEGAYADDYPSLASPEEWESPWGFGATDPDQMREDVEEAMAKAAKGAHAWATSPSKVREVAGNDFRAVVANVSDKYGVTQTFVKDHVAPLEIFQSMHVRRVARSLKKKGWSRKELGEQGFGRVNYVPPTRNASLYGAEAAAASRLSGVVTHPRAEAAIRVCETVALAGLLMGAVLMVGAKRSR